MRIALAQLNPTIGDLHTNAARIRDTLHRAAAESIDLIAFPELAVCGYPPKDLLLKPQFIANVERILDELAALTAAGPVVLVGYVRRNPDAVGRPIMNSLAVLRDGRVAQIYDKCLLPNYDVFDEDRYFESGKGPGIVELTDGAYNVRIGLSICEDLWNDADVFARRRYPRNPIDELARGRVDLIINIAASPFVMGKQRFREQLFGKQAAAHGIPIACASQVGGNDELIFDGASTVFDKNGKPAARARAFDEDLLIVDLNDLTAARCEPYPDDIESVRAALVIGTRDYVRKCGFKQVVIGLSGGVDSALTAAIAVDALGPDNVLGVAMPSRYSSDHSVADAVALARNLNIELKTIALESIHAGIEGTLAPHFDGRPPDITEENLQARLRGNLLMALSNKFGRLLLTTGNKSELAVGYCTLYGDMCGGLAVISDVPKTMVYDLSRHLNARAGRELIPESTLTKLPSAELRPDQHDQQSLPEYDTLDAILQRYIEDEQSAQTIIDQGFDEKTVRDVIRKVDLNEYKRKQMPTGLKVTSRAFGIGRRMPIAARFTI